MGKLIERCAGIDIGKRFLVCCVMTGAAHEDPRSETRRFDTTVPGLKRLRNWLNEERVTDVVMESTGSYWIPVFNLLEGHVTVVLANPEEVKNRKGHKTDRKDAGHLADLLRHNHVKSSYIPVEPVRQLRDLTRRRVQLTQDATRERNRVQKLLEQVNVKIGSVLTDVFGVSGLHMLLALLDGRAAPEEIAGLARGSAKRKTPQLIEAIEGNRMSDHVRFLIRGCLRHLACLEEEMEELDAEILRRMQLSTFQKAFTLLQTIDFVLCFQYRADALRVQDALRKRLGKFGLTLEPTKTKLVEFGRYAQKHAGKRGRKRPETIYFLGFTLCCTLNQKGNFRVGLRTEKSRLRRALMRLQDQMRRMRHEPIREQVEHLNQMLRGHYAYYGIAGNFRALQRVHRAVERYWRKMLSSRSWKGQVWWEQFHQIKARFPLLRPKLYLPYAELQAIATL